MNEPRKSSHQPRITPVLSVSQRVAVFLLIVFSIGYSLARAHAELAAGCPSNLSVPRLADYPRSSHPGATLVSSNDSLLNAAENLLAHGNLKAAEEAYRTLVKETNDPRGFIGLGKVYLARENWNEARVALDNAIQLDPNSIAAQYYGAVTHRELGRWRGAFVPRAISQAGAYARSEELFRSVIQRDSGYQDVLYQYALLLRDQERFGDAMRALCAQLLRSPTPSIAYPGMMRLCKSAIREGHAADILSQIPKPLAEIESYIHGEELRYEGKLAEAEGVFLRMLQKPGKIPAQLAYLSLVRIYAKKGESQRSEDMYWEGVQKIENEAASALVLDDLKYILSPQESLELLSVPIEAKRDQGIPSIWNKRNPTLGSASNPRLAEHYQRLVYAEEKYPLDRERFTYFSGRVLHPDFDLMDIGLIYVRHGPPTEVFRMAGEGFRPDFRSLIKVDVAPEFRNVETWLYDASEVAPKMLFHFEGGLKSFSASGNMETRPPSALQFKSPDKAPPSAKGGVVDVAIQSGPDPGKGLGLTVGPDLAFMDPNYFLVAAGRPGAFDRINDESAGSRNAGLSTDRYRAPKNFKYIQIPNAISGFRTKAAKTLLEVAYVLPGLALLKATGDSTQDLNVESGFAVYDTHWRLIHSVAETVAVSRRDTRTHSVFRLQRLYVRPDSYYVAFFAHPRGSQALGKTELTVRALNFGGVALTASDIQLALEIRSDSVRSLFYKDGLRVVMNPTHAHSIQRPLYAYIEIYNAAKDSKKHADLELNLSINPSKAAGGVLSGISSLFGKKEGYFVSSEVERVKSDGAVVKYFAIDVHLMKPGEYSLQIEVKDKLANERVTRSVPIEFYEPNTPRQ